MSQNCSLYIRHLPNEWTKEDVENLFHELVPATVLNFNEKKKCAIVEFKNETVARDMMNSLHQFDVGGRRLVVEFARQSDIFTSCAEKGRREDEKNEAAISSYLKRWQNYLQSLSHVSDKLQYSSSPALRYFYPPPSASILRNIIVAINSHPRFYTQVLHLMNKMHLPCPFDVEFPIPESMREVLSMPKNEEEVESEESELVSSDENDKSLDIVSRRRKRPKGKIHLTAAKRMRPPITSTAVPSQPVTDVFEQSETAGNRRIDIRISTEPAEPVKDIPMPSGDGFGIMGPVAVPEKDDEEDEEVKDAIPDGILSPQTLSKGCLSASEMATYSVFKRYEPGAPSQRLYIKNVARGVTEEDLKTVFGSFVNWEEQAERDTFHVQLLVSGRMKGQAFITLGSELAAGLAVKCVNGFVLKEKPLVVQFARAMKAKPDEKSLVTEIE